MQASNDALIKIIDVIFFGIFLVLKKCTQLFTSGVGISLLASKIKTNFKK